MVTPSTPSRRRIPRFRALGAGAARRAAPLAVVCCAILLTAAGAVASDEPALPDPSLDRLPPPVRALLEQAREELQQRLASIPQSERAGPLGELGLRYLAFDLVDAAEELLDRATQLAPGTYRWHYYRGVALRAAGRPGPAADSFRRAADLAGEIAPPWIQLGQLDLVVGRSAAAEEHFRRALESDANSAAALVGLARVLLDRSEYDPARELLERARQNDPQATEIDFLLSLALRGQSRPLAPEESEPESRRLEEQSAIRGGVIAPRIDDPLLDELWSLTRESGFYEKRAALQREAGRHTRALSDSERAVVANPGSAAAWIERGRAVLALRDLRGARLALERALGLAPERVDAREELARVLVALGDDDDARRELHTVLEVAPERWQSRLLLAEALRRAERFEPAIEQYRAVTTARPEQTESRLGEGFALVRLQRYAEARRAFESALAVRPDDPGVRDALARLLAAAPADDVRDGPRALELSAPRDGQQRLHPEQGLTWAMAAAETGDFRTAAQLQQRVIEWFSRTGSTELLDALRADLALYESGRPTRVPWAADDPRIAPRPAEPPPLPKTMAQTLQRLAVDVRPDVDVFANAERVPWLAQKIAADTDPDQRNVHRFERAHELLRSGHTEEAAREVRGLIEAYEAAGEAENSENLASLRAFLALTHLRRGEQDNCIEHHTIESCLMPIEGPGVHRIQDGSRAAAAEYARLLEADGDNLRNRWLLNLAYMTLGEYPDGVPEAWRIPPAVFASDYDPGRFRDVAPALGLDVDALAGGSLMEDFDGDGLLDLIVSAWGARDQMRYFHNDGDGGFSEWTERGGLIGELGGLNIVHADYDNDGLADVLVLRGGWLPWGNYPNSLLHNDGDGRFTDVTLEAGVLSYHPTQTATWADFDGDGWLDLFIGNESVEKIRHPSELFLNNRDGTFREAAAESGLQVEAWVKAAVSGDYDNDGRPDLYLSCYGGPNLLFHNEGLQGGRLRFADVTAAAGVAEPGPSFPAWFWDYDNDGWEDILVATQPSFLGDSLDVVVSEYLGRYEGERTAVYHNNGDGTFTDRAVELRLAKPLVAMGANFGDLDNDGWLDCYFGTGQPRMHTLVPNRMFRNAEGRVFQDVTTAGGFGHIQKGHGISFGDLDNDGDQDISAVMGGAYTADTYRNALFLNPGNDNHWITLRLEGVSANRLAIGARVHVRVQTPAGERDIHRTVSSGGSFGGSSLQLEIGLGDATRIRWIEIAWPGPPGPRQRLEGVEMDRVVRVRQGDAPVIVTLPRLDLERALGRASGHHDPR